MRLSADPQKLLAMNAAYEQAFNKMLEKEKQSDEGARHVSSCYVY